MQKLAFRKYLQLMYRILFIILLLANGSAIAATNAERATAAYFASIQNNPQKISDFLQKMPKGGDLHNHLAGASWAENMIRYARNDGLCVDSSFTVRVKPCCSKQRLLGHAKHFPLFYNEIIDAWSMRNFHAGKETGHDHFFATFFKFLPISLQHVSPMINEVSVRACKEHQLYLELMITPEGDVADSIAKRVGWNSNLVQLRKQLLANGLKTVVENISKEIDGYTLRLHKTLAETGCADFQVRYLYQILREQPPEQVFAQLLTGFELASHDPRVVGINMVQAEDGKIAMRDYTLHMKMVGFLHRFYPKVHITLHAGELVPGLVPDSGLRFHIRQAVEIAHAERIGHGVDISHEENSQQLLKEMARRHTLVEINLSSNAAILGVKGKDHPLLLYRRYQVPIALSTDDEGVLRTNITEQYKIAVLNYHFSYPTLKNLVRNSIYYSFLPGANLWQDDTYQQLIPACASSFNSNKLSSVCQRFLKNNQKADLQWQLEQQFIDFEKKYNTKPS